VAVVTTPAVLLRSHPYSESSRVLRFLTRDEGIVGVMAKGVRRRGSRSAPGLDTFAQGDLTLYLKEGRGLQTLKEFTVTVPRRGLGRDPLRLAGGSVLGELVLRHGGEGGGAEIFDVLGAALDAVERAAREAVLSVLLREGWGLVAALGYEPNLAWCPGCGEALGRDDMGRFDFEAAGVRCPRCAGAGAGPRVGPGARAQLAAFLSGTIPDEVSHLRPHLQLLSDFITYHVAHTKPLEAFRILASLLPPEPEGS
jgi:DNA repair protein RecO (recombination protein O)